MTGSERLFVVPLVAVLIAAAIVGGTKSPEPLGVPKIYQVPLYRTDLFSKEEGVFRYIGSGCPVAPTMMFTAGHVAIDAATKKKRELYARLGETMFPLTTLKAVYEVDNDTPSGGHGAFHLDLARLFLEQEGDTPPTFPHPYRIAKAHLPIGSSIVVAGFTDKALLQILPWVGPIVGRDAFGLYILDINLHMGMSGSCLISENGEAVGIVNGVEMDSRMLRPLGLGTPITPDWIPKEFR